MGRAVVTSAQRIDVRFFLFLFGIDECLGFILDLMACLVPKSQKEEEEEMREDAISLSSLFLFFASFK